MLSHQGGAGEHYLTLTYSAFLSEFARGLCPARASQVLEPVSLALLEISCSTSASWDTGRLIQEGRKENGPGSGSKGPSAALPFLPLFKL